MKSISKLPAALSVLLLCTAPGVLAQATPTGMMQERVLPHAELPEGVVAIVAGEEIRAQEFHEALVDESGREVIGDLVKALVVRQAAAAGNIALLAEDIDREVTSQVALARSELARKVGGSKPTLEEVLGMVGSGFEDFLSKLREKVELALKLDALVLLERLATERVKIRLLQMRTETEARHMQHLLSQGAEFGKLARKHSVHGTAATEGLIGPLARGGFEIEYRPVEDAAFALVAPGDVSPVVRVVNAGNREDFFLIQLVERLEEKVGDWRSMRETVLDLRQREPPNERERDEWMNRRLDELTAAEAIKVDPK